MGKTQVAKSARRIEMKVLSTAQAASAVDADTVVVDLENPDATAIDRTFKNAAGEESFYVIQLKADLADPAAGDTIDVTDLNSRGFIDVTFALPSYATGWCWLRSVVAHS